MIVSSGALAWPATVQCSLDDLGLTGDQKVMAADLAVNWLWAMSGRRFGTRSVVDRPATGRVCVGMDYPSFLQSIYSPLGWPFDYDPRTGQRSYRQVVELERDALSVTTVSITDSAGVNTVLNPSLYRLEGNYLVRQDGGQWPLTQNMVAALGQPDTWAVTYVRGVLVPAGGQLAAGLLTCEFGKAIAGQDKCKLPYNVQTATRAGVTVVRDTTKALTTTGIAAVDQWVNEVNPGGLRQPPQVWSPDTARNQRPYLGSYYGATP